MVKTCPKCGTVNSDDIFWCTNCNYKLLSKIRSKLEFEQEEFKKEQQQNYENKKSMQKEFSFDDVPLYKPEKNRYIFSMLKIPFAIIFVAVLIFSTFYFVSNIGQGTDFWDKFGGCPWDENNLPWSNNDFPWVESLSMDNILNSWDGSYDFSDIGQMNDDYWFEGNTIKTNTGWTFTINEVMDCSYTAKVLDYYVYNKDNVIYQPCELFSQVDIFFGFDDLIDHPEKYPYRVVSHFYRGVYVECSGSSQASNYFMSHCTNTHIIPHSQQVINTLMTIQKGDIVEISGSYVNVFGQQTGSRTQYSWTTDTVIGNSNCEIILLDNIIIH